MPSRLASPGVVPRTLITPLRASAYPTEAPVDVVTRFPAVMDERVPVKVLLISAWLFVRSSFDVASEKLKLSVMVSCAGVSGNVDGAILAVPPEPIVNVPIVRLTREPVVLPPKLTLPFAVTMDAAGIRPMALKVAPDAAVISELASVPVEVSVRVPPLTMVEPRYVLDAV